MNANLQWFIPDKAYPMVNHHLTQLRKLIFSWENSLSCGIS